MRRNRCSRCPSTTATIIRSSANARTTPGRKASGSRSAPPPTSRSTPIEGHRLGPGEEGRAAAAAQLLLARLRQPRRHLAAVRAVRAAQTAGGAQHQLAALRVSPADHPTRYAQRGDEVVGHGRTNAERQGDLWELDEKRLIDEVTAEILSARAGRRTAGWARPRPRATSRIDLLKEAGYKYVMDWPADDQPFWLRTRSGPILSVPYPAELNDPPRSSIARIRRASSPT